MNYIKIYNGIIKNSYLRINDGYCENHHIIPKCMNGNNSKDNLVRLTYREHFLCHWLLCKIYPENYKLKSSFFKMLENTKTKKRFVSSKEYNNVKRLLKDVKYPWLHKWQIENGSWNKGKKGVQVAWNKGIKEQRILCDYCGKDANPGNFKRWHGKSCKLFISTDSQYKGIAADRLKFVLDAQQAA